LIDARDFGYSILEAHQLDPVTEARSSHVLDIQAPSNLTLIIESSEVRLQDPLCIACHLRADRSILDFVAVFDRLADATGQLVGFLFD
jgi:hypothetical protein